MGITAFSTEQELSDARISFIRQTKDYHHKQFNFIHQSIQPDKDTSNKILLCTFSHYNQFPIKTHQRKKKLLRTYLVTTQIGHTILSYREKEDYSACFLHSHNIYKFCPSYQESISSSNCRNLGPLGLGINKLHQNFLPQLSSCRSFAKLGAYLRFSCYWL